MKCECCKVAATNAYFSQFNPRCIWCGARYLKAVKLVASGQKLEEWRLHILDTWEKAGHDRKKLAELAKPSGIPLEPVQEKGR